MSKPPIKPRNFADGLPRDPKESEEGLLARLSASGGRNIDLLKRAQDAEAKLAAVESVMAKHWDQHPYTKELRDAMAATDQGNSE